MKEMFYLVLDVVYDLCMGIMLADFFHSMLQERIKIHGRKVTAGSIIICAQYVLVHYIMEETIWAKQLLYGADMYMKSSRQSIGPLMVSFCTTLCMGRLIYKGKWIKLLSLTAVFYALRELVRFMFFTVSQFVLNYGVEYYNQKLLIQESISLAEYQQAIERVEVVWNICFSSILLLVFIFCVLQYKKQLIVCRQMYHAHEAGGLLIPGVLGLAFAVMIRCILFSMTHTKDASEAVEWFSLIEDYPEMKLMIPCMSCFCIAVIFLSVKLLGKTAREHEKRLQAEIFKNQTAELAAQAADMEEVYEKFRGMKHDLKNYTADIQALLAGLSTGDKSVEQELYSYVHSMQNAIESLEYRQQTGNPVTDVILTRYMRLAEKKNIKFTTNFFYPKFLEIDAFDMSCILHNGLENAIEACEKYHNPEKWIKISAKQKGRMFLIRMENSFSGKIQWYGEFPVSEKDGHGYGLKNIKNCAEKYFGNVLFETEENIFSITIMLQGKLTFNS